MQVNAIQYNEANTTKLHMTTHKTYNQYTRNHYCQHSNVLQTLMYNVYTVWIFISGIWHDISLTTLMCVGWNFRMFDSSLGWFEGQPTGNHLYSGQIWGFPWFPCRCSLESIQCLMCSSPAVPKHETNGETWDPGLLPLAALLEGTDGSIETWSAKSKSSL